MAKTNKMMAVLPISLLVAVVQLCSGVAWVQGMSPTASPPAPDCMSILIDNLMDCLDYVTPGNYSKVPPMSCCTGLATIVKTNPICLCQFLGNRSEIVGFPINGTKASGLPAVCNVSTPSHSLCPKVADAVVSPGSSPAPSPHHAMSPAPPSPESPPSSEGPGTAPGPMPGSSSVRMRSTVGVVLAGLLLIFAVYAV